jgi:hypothetical protein
MTDKMTDARDVRDDKAEASTPIRVRVKTQQVLKMLATHYDMTVLDLVEELARERMEKVATEMIATLQQYVPKGGKR